MPADQTARFSAVECVTWSAPWHYSEGPPAAWLGEGVLPPVMGGAVGAQTPPIVEECAPALVSPAAEDTAYGLLEDTLGAEAARQLRHGGGYAVRSRHYVGVEYLVARQGPTMILRRGVPVGTVCLEVNAQLPWPDRVLHLVKAIEADETVVYATGHLLSCATPPAHGRPPGLAIVELVAGLVLGAATLGLWMAW